MQEKTSRIRPYIVVANQTQEKLQAEWSESVWSSMYRSLLGLELYQIGRLAWI